MVVVSCSGGIDGGGGWGGGDGVGDSGGGVWREDEVDAVVIVVIAGGSEGGVAVVSVGSDGVELSQPVAAVEMAVAIVVRWLWWCWWRRESKSSQDDGFQPSSDDENKVDEDPRQESECTDQKKVGNVNSTNNVNVVGTNRVNVVGANTNNELPFDPEMLALEDISTFNFSSDHEEDDE
nr:hypothetical protein [Tanacetum cinerariifolium]